MDQIKTGKFIADERKKKGYTQRQLAEQLGISDKTISKWERGNGFPEISLLLPLCNELDLSVNELLTGERISETEYREKEEENMVNLVKEASGMVSALVIIAATPMFVVAGAFPMEDWMRIALIAVGIVVIVIGIAIACILDRDAGAYECPECKTRFVPEMGAYVMGPHTLTRRKLVCPHCGAHRYCKKVLTR